MKSPYVDLLRHEGAAPVEHIPDAIGRPAMQSRAYQVEMFEESLKRNTIVCMSTGSGKTLIAKLRIEAELKKSPAKIVWFLAPSVALCQQQHTHLSRHQLPAHQFRIITSLDNVDHWSTRAIWDAALWNIQVVISTPQPLLDALSHGFIQMRRISLLVFDEAHHCVKNAPMNKIMQTFYHPAKREGLGVELPHILGLSASPVTSSASTLENLEGNLDAICKTPTHQKDEYRQFVHEPEFLVLPYTTPDSDPQPQILNQLRHLIDELDINEDPYIKSLRQNGSDKSKEKLLELLLSRETATFKQLQALDRRANNLLCELGEWGCNSFVGECAMRLHNSDVNINRSFHTLYDQELNYLDNLLSPIGSEAANCLGSNLPPDKISTKASVLVDLLVREHSSDLRCVIFVKQRSVAWALSRLLNLHPECQGKYSAEPFVGLSKVDRNIRLIDLVKMRDPSEVLANFRSGRVNVVVATSVMEEGVDIPATNLVIRFDDSENFRSFIQSRGRARHPNSKFVTLLQAGRDGTLYESWKALEIEMKAKYADERRQIAEIEEEEDEEDHRKTFRVESTGATLTLDSAIQHIEHFCSKLPKVAYLDDPRPEFVLKRVADVGISAKIILPTSVATELRQFSGPLCKTERMAKKAAAFEAYIGIYHAGLVNDNLLPVVVPEMQDAMSIQIESREGICQARNRIEPWREMATRFDLHKAEMFALRVDVIGKEQQISSVLLVLPQSIRMSLNIPLLWTPSLNFTALVTPSNEHLPASFEPSTAQKTTHHLMRTIYSRKMRHQDLALDGYPCMIVPANQVASLKEWLDNPLEMMPEDEKKSLESHLVRRRHHNIPYFFRDSTTQNDMEKRVEIGTGDRARTDSAGFSGEYNSEELGLESFNMVDVMRLPKRVDFLHPAGSEKAHTAWEAVPWSECSIENLPASYARMMLFIPSILHVIGIGLVAQTAVDTVLSPIGFKDAKNVMTALTASAAHEFINYQSLEFLGDSLLKYYTSLQLFTQYPKWHEGYLSRKKDSIVGNARLCRAALDVGLDQFIHTEPFAGAQWKVRTNADLRSEPDEQAGRQLSTKVLADVVEALIGAAYMDGTDLQDSERRSLACLRFFLPELLWDVPDNIARCHYPQLPEDVSVEHFATVEALVGYEFKNRTLIAEALTHPSAIEKFNSYQRLEYLGDAVLDHIVVATIFRAADETLKAPAMHLIRTAIVNADFLAFLCLETTIDLERFDVAAYNLSHKCTVTSRTERKHLCHFLTATGNSIMSARQACIKRHQQLREKINEAIRYGTSYPWLLLIRLHADKFFSDIIESILGAVYLDSQGSISACEGFLGKIGLLSYLQRLIAEPSVEIMHPKEKLGVVSGNAKLTYQTCAERGEDGEARYTGKVIKDGDVFAISDEGFSKLEVETGAAELAVAKIAASKQLARNAREN